MALAWNTRQLLSKDRTGGSPIEFHFLSHREIYDSSIKTADRHHSSAGEWAVHGDHHWYTVAVITRPVYGAVALRRIGENWDIATARPAGQNRPWARAKAQPSEAAQPSTAARPQPRDATPRPEDLEAGD